jgi:hypothetical protein
MALGALHAWVTILVRTRGEPQCLHSIQLRTLKGREGAFWLTLDPPALHRGLLWG